MVLAGSRFLRPNEEGWAPVEGEALALVYALQKTKYFVLGCKDLVIATDHRPLLGIFGEKKLENIENPRLRKLKEKTMAFRYSMVHVPGRKHPGPDAMSRNPVEKEGLLEGVGTKEARVAILAGMRIIDEDWDPELEDDPAQLVAAAGLEGYVCPLSAMVLGVQAVTWERVQHETAMDPVMRQLVDLVENGFPENKELLPYDLREFFKHRTNLSLCQGVILYNWRVLVPRSLRLEVLEGLHSGHQCVVGMRARAANSVFWPGIDAAIQSIRDRCKVCNTIAPSQASEPAVTAPPPLYPFQQVCSDYFELDGATYVTMVDRYSGWPSVHYFPRGTANSQALIDTLRDWFMLFGIPEELSSDGGLTYVSQDTQDFFKAWGVKHRLSSVAFPHSNARAELGVKSCKRMIRENTGPKGALNCDKFGRALLQYRNTPMQGINLSPAQILFGKEIRDFLPFAPGKAGIRSEWRITAEEREAALAKKHCLNLERLNSHVKELLPLKVGQSVFVQNQSGNYPLRWGKTGVVVEMGPGPRQYYVRMDGSRRVSLRNRKYLRKSTAVADVLNQDMVEDKSQQPEHSTAAAPRSPSIPQQSLSSNLYDHDQTAGRVLPQPNDDQTSTNQLLEIPLPEVTAPVPAPAPQSLDRGAGGEGERRYPVRERKQNVKLRDFEVYGIFGRKKAGVKMKAKAGKGDKGR